MLSLKTGDCVTNGAQSETEKTQPPEFSVNVDVSYSIRLSDNGRINFPQFNLMKPLMSHCVIRAHWVKLQVSPWLFHVILKITHGF